MNKNHSNSIVTITCISALSLFFSCTGNNPVNQIMDLLKSEFINTTDQDCNCKDTINTDTLLYNDFSGCWIIKQSNGYSGVFKLNQTGCTVSGITSWDGHENGVINGKVNGSNINFTIVYPNKDTVHYSAILNDDSSSITSGTYKSTLGQYGTFDANKGNCNPVSIEGCWSVDQNNGHIGILTFKQNGTTISGISGWTTHSNGPISGSITESKLSFTITYPEGVIGYYYGTISDDGTNLLSGYGKSSTGDSANWFAIKTDCEIPTPNIQGCWSIDQNNGHIGILTFKQNGTTISGISGWTTHSNGPISGSITGSKLSFTITYPEGVIGYYYGTVSDDVTNLLSGYGKSSTGDSANWFAIKTVCEIPTPNIQGCWSVDQNNGHIGILTFKQNGTTISGISGWTTHSNGPISGSITGSKLSFTITYPEGVIGYYYGTISDDGTNLLSGYGKSSTGDSANWFAIKTVCEIPTPNIQGCWSIDQNNGHIGILTFKQNGTTISGISG